MQTPFTRSKWKSALASIMPGLFLVGYNIGTGSITSMSKAGANFGVSLLWAVLLGCIATYYLVLLFSRYSMATGETVLYGIRRHIHPALAFFLIVVLSPIILAALLGVLGIVSESLHVWSESLHADSRGIDSTVFAVGLSALCYLLLWDGRFQLFQRILVVLVTIMGVSFVWIAFLYLPPPSELIQGFLPKLPATAEGSTSNALVITAGMIGTTVSVFAFLVRSGSVVQAGWTMRDMPVQRRDARISVGLMFLLSAAILITASATLHERGLKMNDISEMVHLMEPIAGKWATAAFVMGIVAAGLSSHMPNLLMIPWMIRDYRGEPRSTNTPGFRFFLLVLCVFSIAGTVFRFQPVPLMILSQACIAVVLPVTLLAVIYLTSNKKIMGEHVNRPGDYVMLALILPFTLFMGFLGIRGVFDSLFS